MRSFKHTLLSLVLVFVLSSFAYAAPDYFILKGDLHCHSDFSHDSDVPIEQVVRESGIAGYDFIAVTDHNTVRHMMQDHSTDEVLVIAGYEHTTQAAHINIFGLRQIPRRSAIYTLEEMEEYLEPLRARGAIIQLDHPNDKLYYSRFGYDLEFNFIEILNGVWREDDHQTLLDWQDLLVAGRKIVATAGSDAHRNHTVRRAFNNVYVTERTEEAILEALLAGRNFVTVSADGPVISMVCDDVVMGGAVEYHPDQQMQIEISQVQPGTILRLYTNYGLHLEDVHPGGSYKVTVDTRLIDFCRVELWGEEQAILAYSNPIFIEH